LDGKGKGGPSSNKQDEQLSEQDRWGEKKKERGKAPTTVQQKNMVVATAINTARKVKVKSRLAFKGGKGKRSGTPFGQKTWPCPTKQLGENGVGREGIR